MYIFKPLKIIFCHENTDLLDSIFGKESIHFTETVLLIFHQK